MSGAPDSASSYRDKKVVVTGAAGFIGRWVARHAAERGAHVFACVRSADRAAEVLPGFVRRARVVEVDLTDAAATEEMLKDVRPHVVFNLAGYGVDRSERDPDLAMRLNAEAVRTLAAAVARRADKNWPGSMLVHVGSALEYGRSSGDLVESTVPTPFELYGKTKLLGTEYLSRESRALGLTSLTARLFTVYGAGEHPGRLLPTLLEARRTSGSIPLSPGTQLRDFTFVGDTAEGLLRLGESTATFGEIFNLATGRLTSVRTFVERAAAVLGIESSRLDFGAVPMRAEEMQHAPVSIAKLRDLIGWAPSTTIDEGVRLTGDAESSGSR